MKNNTELLKTEDRSESLYMVSDKIAEIVQRHWYKLIGLFFVFMVPVLYLPGVDWHLPDRFWGDEGALVGMAQSVDIGKGWLLIEGKLGFWYGPAYIYQMAFVFFLFDKFAIWAGWFPASDAIPYWIYFWLARSLAVLYMTATVAILIFLFKKFWGRATALLGGFLFVFHPAVLETAFVAKPDPLVYLLGTATLYMGLRLIERRSWIFYVFSGFIYGWAVAAKLFAMGLFAALISGHVMAQRGHNIYAKLVNALKDMRWLILLFAAIAGYCLGNPQIFVAMKSFLLSVENIVFGVHMTSTDTYKIQGLSNQLYRLWQVSVVNVSILELWVPNLGKLDFLRGFDAIIPVSGIIILLYRRSKEIGIILPAFIAVHIFAFPAIARYGGSHYLLVLNPTYALLTAISLVALVQKLHEKLNSMKFEQHAIIAYVAPIALLSIILFPLLGNVEKIFKTYGKGIISRETDYRSFMIENIPPGSRILFDYYGTELLPGYFDVVRSDNREAGLEYFTKKYDYLIVSNDRLEDYKVHQELLNLPNSNRSGLPRLVAEFNDREGLFHLPLLRLFKLNESNKKNKSRKFINFYTETLIFEERRNRTFKNPSFEHNLTGNWGVQFIPLLKGEQTVKWWDTKSKLPNIHIERRSNISSDGEHSLYINLTPDEQFLTSKGEWYNALREENKNTYFESPRNDWETVGDHSTSIAGQDDAFEGTQALQITSLGEDERSNEGQVLVLHQRLSNYEEGQDNILSFYAKSGSGNKTLRVRSFDNTITAVNLTDDYKKYEIKGTAKERTHLVFKLAGPGTFYLDEAKFLVSNTQAIEMGQVIPYDFLEGLRYFSIDYYIPCSTEQSKSEGSARIHFIATSRGGQYLGKETYTLWDSEELQVSECGSWLKLKTNVKSDFNKPFIRWNDIEFMTFIIELRSLKSDNFEVYIDNIKVAKPVYL